MDEQENRFKELMTEKYFIYGSLLKGMYNHPLMTEGKYAKYLGKANLKGYKMKSMGSYPAIIKSNTDDDVVVGELYEFIDIEALKSVYNMEIGASYKLSDVYVEFNEEQTKAKVFEYELPERIMSREDVKNGDWKKHCDEGL